MYLSPQKLQPEGIARSNVLVESPPTGKTSPQKPPRYSSVLLFQRKVGRLAYVRLKQLCCEVRLHTHHPKLERTIWTLLEHTILKEFTLLKDRHLDQVILCSMYGVCKVHNVDLRFKTIVTSYKTLPHANPKTFRQVLIRDGKFDTIIVFYNLVFMQRLKNNILSLASTQSPNLSPIPPIPMSPSNAARSPICVPGHPNITVNSLNQSGHPGSMTPRSRVLTCIGEYLGSPGRQTINLTVEPGCIPHSAKRLPFEREGTRNKALPLTKKRKLHFEQEDEADEEKEAGTDGEIFGGIGPLQNPKEESSSAEESVVHRKLASLVEERPPTKDNQSGNTPRLCHQ
uniref:retinoblastoma-associated protein-like n=1 Tax=Myxine glutinosa TaxID=7769 RepID=UPI00358FD9E0